MSFTEGSKWEWGCGVWGAGIKFHVSECRVEGDRLVSMVKGLDSGLTSIYIYYI